MNQTPTVVPLDNLREKIRSAGLRVTSPRVAVLQQLLTATAPVSHAELVDQLAPQGWDRATIFRNLTDLTEVGLLRRTDLGDHVWRFELMGEGTDTHAVTKHPHFVCGECGDVQCLPEETVELHTATGAPRSVRGREVEIQLKGRCDRCA
jgi:Fur family transcriptional regulator, ferric uptake regulator